MDYDFSELDASLAQLNAEFAGLESGINQLNDDSLSEFLVDPKAKKPESYDFFSDWDNNNNNKPSRDPLDAALEELDHITPRGNTLDKALNEIDALIDPPDLLKKNSSRKGKQLPAHSRKSTFELGNRRVMMGTSRHPGVGVTTDNREGGFGGNGKQGSGPLYFKAPEMVDLKGVSLEEAQRIVLTFHDQLVRMADEANVEIQEYNKQIQILDEDNAKAFKTIQELQSDLNNQQEDWNNSDKQLKTRVAKLEQEEKKLKTQLAASATSDAQIQGYEKEIEEYKHQLNRVKYESLQSSNSSTPGSPMDMERYKVALRTLNQKKTQLEKRVFELEQELLTRSNTPGLQAQLETRDIEIQKLRQQVNYLIEEKKALQETFSDFTSAGISEQFERQLKSQQQEIESLNRQIAGSTAEKRILQGQLEQLEKDLSAKGSADTVPLLKLRVRHLEAENESGNVKIKRLVAAIKADRAQSEEKLDELRSEKEEQEQRADRFEAKMIQLIEMVRVERKKHQEENNNQAALDAARETLRETEIQIRQANEAASAAERALQQKELELQKVLLFGKKKAREAQNALEDIKALEEKSNKLVDAVRTLRADNLQLKSTGSRTNLTGSASLIEELEATSQRAQKLEQAVRKLRQMVSNLEAEAADKERAYEEGLKTAENRIKAAEERAKNATTAFSPHPSIPGPGAPPPPPPPLPNIKLNYEIRINKTGQATHIVGEPGQPRNPRNVFVDSIVEAIKKGVTLKKTGLRESYDENSNSEVSISDGKDDELSMEDDFAAMAREIAMNKQKRERNKTFGEAETKKKGGELDNLLKELEDLDALIQ